MPFRVRYNDPVDGFVDITDRVQVLGDNPLTVDQDAEEGSVAISRILIDDPDGDIEIIGHRLIKIDETDAAADEKDIYVGFTADREISRGGKYFTGAGRVWDTAVVDVNSHIGRRIVVGTDANRGAETDVARIAWLLSTAELGLVTDDLYVDTTDGVAMDAADYRGQNVDSILNDAAQASGRNFFIWWNEPEVAYSLWYKHAGDEVWDSPLRISNVASDVDSTTTFAPAQDAKLRRDPSRVASGVYLPYDGGYVYEERPATATAFMRRDTAAPSINVKSVTKATARAIRYLNDATEEDDVITATIRVPKAKVNHALAGMRIEARFTHLPGYEEFTWLRILKRSVTQVSLDRYDIKMDLSGSPTNTVACSTSLSTIELSDSGETTGGGGVASFTPTTPGAFPVVVVGVWGVITTYTFLEGTGDITLTSPYTLLHEYSEGSEHAAYATGYNAITSGSPGAFLPVWPDLIAGSQRTLAIAISTAATTPVQSGSQSVSGSTVTLPDPPTEGNILVGFKIYVPGHEQVFEGPPDGWTLVAESRNWDGGVSDLVMAVIAKCVTEEDAASEVIEIEGSSFAHWTSLSEWVIS